MQKCVIITIFMLLAGLLSLYADTNMLSVMFPQVRAKTSNLGRNLTRQNRPIKVEITRADRHIIHPSQSEAPTVVSDVVSERFQLSAKVESAPPLLPTPATLDVPVLESAEPATSGTIPSSNSTGRLTNTGQHCSMLDFGLNGAWVPGAGTEECKWVRKAYPTPSNCIEHLEWDDSKCGRLPPFDEETFCKSSLNCSTMLVVGDSTQAQMFEVLVVALGRVDCAPYNNKVLMQSCGTIRCPVCSRYCASSVPTLSFIRSNHLNDHDWGNDPLSNCKHWMHTAELRKHHHLFLNTGAHINNHPDLLANASGAWETRTEQLIQFLREHHPRNIIWRMSWYGIEPWERTCPNDKLISPAPLSRDQIKDEFRGSWRLQIDYNAMMKARLSAGLDGVIMIDPMNLLGMRGDCRYDNYHFHLGADTEAAALWQWPRILQYFTLHSATSV